MPVSLKNTKLFKAIKVGKNELSNRVVFAPSTRCRALPDHSPSDLQYEYYDSRSKYPGTLLVTEGVIPSLKMGISPNVPGIYNDKQIQEWKKITDKVHENGSFLAVQLWGLGRTANPAQSKKEGVPLKGVSLSYAYEKDEAAAKEAGNELTVYTTEELDALVEEYVQAGKNAVAAGFDYAELHGASGYLINQLFEEASNQRTDKYGGSIENRCRFALNVIDRLSEEIGHEKVAIRISPWLKFNGMKAEENDTHPVATFGYFLGQLQKRADAGKQIAYVSVMEPRMPEMSMGEDEFASNEFIKTVWKGILMRTGAYTYDVAEFKQLQEDLEDGRTLAGFSRYFISNPDLVYRLRDGTELNAYDRSTFYVPYNWGFNTYLAAGENKEYDQKAEEARMPGPIAVTA